MFCHDCGKEIADGVKFCPYCGQSQKLSESKHKTDTSPSDDVNKESMNTKQDATISDYAPKAKEVIQQVADTVVSSAKSIGEKINDASDGNAQVYAEKAKETALKVADTAVASAKTVGEKVNEATDGKAQTYADKARETAQDFVNDVQQVTKDKDTDNFFKKNNSRNCKIILGLIAVIIGIFIMFGGNSKYHKDAINEAEYAASLMKGTSSIDSSSVLYEADRGELKGMIVSVKTTGTDKKKFTILYLVLINTKTGKIQAVPQGAALTNDEKETQLTRIKNSLVKEGFTIK